MKHKNNWLFFQIRVHLLFNQNNFHFHGTPSNIMIQDFCLMQYQTSGRQSIMDAPTAT